MIILAQYFKMELINPRNKKFGKFLSTSSVMKQYKGTQKIKGKFNGFSVYINDNEDMKKLIEMGYFGKANFSRSYPQYNKHTEIIRARQYDKRKEWSQKNLVKTSNFKKIIIVPDSDNEYENFFNNLKPVFEIDKSGINEVLYLCLEEAFFLVNCLESLDICVESKNLNSEKLWILFSETDPFFITNYIAYNYFRSKNWVIKPGIKFGGDFLLYKEGPSFYHASYVVIIDVFNEEHKRVNSLSKRSMDNISLLCLNRLCETAGKELMICEITLPEIVNYNNLNNVVIKENLVNRCTDLHEAS